MQIKLSKTDVQTRIDRIDSLVKQAKRCFLNCPTLETLEKYQKIVRAMSMMKEGLIHYYQSPKDDHETKTPEF